MLPRGSAGPSKGIPTQSPLLRCSNEDTPGPAARPGLSRLSVESGPQARPRGPISTSLAQPAPAGGADDMKGMPFTALLSDPSCLDCGIADGVVGLGTEAARCHDFTDLGAEIPDPQDYSFHDVSDTPFTTLWHPALRVVSFTSSVAAARPCRPARRCLRRPARRPQRRARGAS